MQKNKTTIFVSGSLVYDRIMDFPGYFRDHIMPDKIHILNVAFAVNNMRESFGGTAGNIAYNLSLLGERTSIIAAVGNDFAPYKKWLLKNKIDISRVKMIKEKRTASCHIITDKADNQITGFHADALNEESFNDKINNCHCEELAAGDEAISVSTSAEIASLRPAILRGSARNDINYLAIISPGNIKDMGKYADYYKKNKIKYIFDPGQAIPALEPNVLRASIKGAGALVGNDYEVSLLSQKTGWTLNNLIDKVEMLIITKGENGSIIYSDKKRHIIKPVKVKKALDPTGAGDAYRAGLIKGMIEGLDVKKIGQLASVIASFAVEKHGTQEHRFGWKEVKKRYNKSYKENFLFL